MAGIVQAPSPFSLQAIAGLPFVVSIPATFTDGSGNPIPWSDITGASVLVTGYGGSEVTAYEPTVTSPVSGTWEVSWSAAQTTAMGTQSVLSYALLCSVSATPVDLIAGNLRMVSQTTPGAATTTSLPLTVQVGTVTAQVTVELGNVGGDVASVTAADSTITVGGTVYNPTLKVTPGTFDAAGAAAAVQANLNAETNRAETAEQANATAISNETNRAVAAEALLAPINNPTFTGTVGAPTVRTGTGAGYFQMNGTNGLQFFSTGTTSDLRLYRSGTSTFTIDSNTGGAATLIISNELIVNGSAGGRAIQATVQATTNFYICGFISGDAQPRVVLESSAAGFGSGATPPDVWITRTSAGVLTISASIGGTGIAYLNVVNGVWAANYRVGTVVQTGTASPGLGSPGYQAVDASSGTASIYLPPNSTCAGIEFVIEKVDNSSNAVKVIPNGTDTIRGVNASAILANQWDQITLVSSGTGDWYVKNVRFAPVEWTASTAWTCPLTGWWDVLCLGAGASGGGAGAALTSGGVATQVGGAGGGAGMNVRKAVYLTAGTVYNVVIGAGGVGGVGGAANGGAGTRGTGGGATSFGGSLVSASGGSSGQASAGNSTATSNGGAWGMGNPTNYAAGTGFAGCGSQGSTGTQQSASYPTPYGVGGTAGNSATAAVGGNGGNVTTGWGEPASYTAGNTATTAGGNGASATVYGAGGGGGGGGAPGGPGGNGGNGAPGFAKAELIS